ncbi:MAG: c-type cytochrome [Alphaproteobacteria bacterium]|nr:c-type cytochrome [Alphaproteobacteria bacterium]
MRRRSARLWSVAFTALALAAGPAAAAQVCASDNGGITLPPGFCATVFADGLGHVRHLAVARNGVVYANSWSGAYYGRIQPKEGGFLIALQDTDGDGRADRVKRFGASVTAGAAGGTGVAVYDGAVYAEEKDKILRYKLPASGIAPTGAPEVVLSGLPLTGDHPMHSIVIDSKGALYVDLGSATNACQAKNRIAGEPGQVPCTELETRGGIWRYDADKTGQRFSPAERFATGIRNGEGLAADGTGVYATQHGRDQLFENWPKLYSQQQGADLPAEELLRLRQGADFGWPMCYYDGAQGKLVLAPEYGGDGKAVGICAGKRPPVAAFPAHWAPNALALYHGKQFPSAYAGGAFIAFHGSWNRAPSPQGGYNVVFQPLANGKAAGPYVVFADGFAGAYKNPGQAAHRPAGLAVGPDGALFVSDDMGGRIWRITYHGDAGAAVQPAPAPKAVAPEAVDTSRLPVPPGMTAAQVAAGEKLFRGQTCGACHGSNAKGTPFGPDLTTGRWLWGDGSMASITGVITDGVAKPKEYAGAMPPMGGVALTPAQLKAVAAYVWAVGHAGPGRP